MIPVVVVTGFLGSGKTSMIARLLDRDRRQGLSVLVHDLGEENIDVAYLQGGEHVELASDGRIRSVSSGRFTASHEDQLMRGLDEQCRNDPLPSAILVETSGAADVRSLVEKLRSAQGLWELVSVIAVLDASLLRYYREDPVVAPLLERQASAASLLVLNKWDRASRIDKSAARRYIRSLRGSTGASMARSSFGRVRSTRILKPRKIPRGSAPTAGNTESSIASFHLKERRPFHPGRFERWLSRPWPGIIRVKGFVWLATDMDGVYVVDTAGPQREIGLEGTWYAAVASGELDEAVRHLTEGFPWGDRRQILTVIGSESGIAVAAEELEAALLSEEEMEEGPAAWKNYPDPLTPQFS